MLSKTCISLIEKSQNYHPTYANGKLAIHLPMSLIALDKMKASDEQFQLFFEKNSKKHDLRKTHKIKINNIQEALGKPLMFEEAFVFFEEQINLSSVKEVLENTLDILIKGLFASAFHPAIRLSYAIEINNKKEIAMALASWTTEYEELKSSFTSCDNTVEEIMLNIKHIGINNTLPPGNIVSRMNEIDKILTEEKIVFHPEELSFEKIRSFCISSYSKNNNFTLLHTVTACHAFRLLTPYITKKELAIKYLWQSIVTAYLTTGLDYTIHSNIECRNSNKIKYPTISNWEEIIKKAVTSVDEHDVKIVYTAWQEYNKYNINLYQFVAERAVKKL